MAQHTMDIPIGGHLARRLRSLRHQSSTSPTAADTSPLPAIGDSFYNDIDIMRRPHNVSRRGHRFRRRAAAAHSMPSL